MINFTLPGFFYNFKINKYFETLNNEHKNFFKNQNINFSSFTGNFPYTYWNGGYNNCQGKSLTYKDLIAFQLNNNYIAPIRFNCSNILINEYDFEDTLMNVILEMYENGSNFIEVSNPTFFEFLKNKYPNYKYILSNNLDLIIPFDSNIIDICLKDNLFYLIQIPYSKAKDIEFLKKLSNKKNIEIPVTTSCNIDCYNFMKCLEKEHYNQYNFSENNIFKNCSYHKDCNLIKPLITLEEIEKIYIPLGFNHFYFAEIINDKIDNYKNFLIAYFIKEEYQKIVLQEMEKIIYD